MGWPIYSERFLHHQATGYWQFIVPEGKRAVITNVDAISTLAPTPWLNVRVGPITFVYMTFPVPNVAQHEVCRVVAYQGEVIELINEQTGVHVTICGYLFDDQSGATGPPARSTWRPLQDEKPTEQEQLDACLGNSSLP